MSPDLVLTVLPLPHSAPEALSRWRSVIDVAPGGGKFLLLLTVKPRTAGYKQEALKATAVMFPLLNIFYEISFISPYFAALNGEMAFKSK